MAQSVPRHSFSFLSFALLFFSAVFVFVGCNFSSSSPSQETSIVVPFILEGTSYSPSLAEGATALDLLILVAQQENIPLEIQGERANAFINAIGGKVGGTDGKYWLYFVNGRFAEVGAGQYVLKPDDVIEWKFE